MRINPPVLLVDTNVWLDIFLPHRPGRTDALAFLEEAEARDASLAYPAHALLDVYQKVRVDNKRWIRESRELTQGDALAVKRMAWDYVALMQEVATAIPVDAHDVALACSFRDVHDDLEDDLVLAACQRAHANYLVTTDTSLATHAPIEAKTPAQMAELLHQGRARGTPVAREATSATDWLYTWLAEHDES